MKKIKELELFNFQSHSHTKLVFDSGLNVITGPSDQGKSSLIRALRWVLYNEPNGSDFIKMGCNECQVKITLKNDYQIIRKRNKKENGYIIISPEGEKEVLEKVGRSVPEEVKKLHGMPKISWDTDSKMTLNLDYQLDGAFLLNESSYTRAKVLGRLSRVHVVDSAIRDTVRDTSKLKRRRETLEDDIERIDEKLEKFSDLEALAREIEQEKRLLAKLKESKKELAKLTKLQKKFKEAAEKEKNLKELLAELSQIEQLKTLVKKLSQKEKRLEKLKELRQAYNKQQRESKQVKKIINATNNLSKLKSKEIKLRNRLDKYQKLTEINKKLSENYLRSNNNQKLLKETARIKEVKKIARRIKVKKEKLMQLKKRVDKEKLLNEKLNKQNRFYNNLSEVKKVARLKDDLVKKTKLLQQLKELNNRRKDLAKSIDKGKKFIKDNEKKLDRLVNKYNDFLEDIGKCPICFNQINETTIAEIVDNYRRG